ERLEAFPAQFRQHRGGGYVAVTPRAAVVRLGREDRRYDGTDLIIGQWMIATQHRRARSKAGCELHGIFLGKRASAGRPETAGGRACEERERPSLRGGLGQVSNARRGCTVPLQSALA